MVGHHLQWQEWHKFFSLSDIAKMTQFFYFYIFALLTKKNVKLSENNNDRQLTKIVMIHIFDHWVLLNFRQQ